MSIEGGSYLFSLEWNVGGGRLCRLRLANEKPYPLSTGYISTAIG
jgi:hypothetical protein